MINMGSGKATLFSHFLFIPSNSMDLAQLPLLLLWISAQPSLKLVNII
jgi:hypothetical protein